MTPPVVISSTKKKTKKRTKKQPVRIKAMPWVHSCLMDRCIFDIALFQIRANGELGRLQFPSRSQMILLKYRGK